MTTIIRTHFDVTCRDALASQAIWLAELVESIAEQKAGLAAGTTFQVGWSILTLAARDGRLVLCEPDFDGDPLDAVRPDVSTSLTVLLQQRALLSRVNCSPVDMRFDERVMLYKGCLDETGLYGERSEAGEGDSGWYFGPTREHDAPGAGELESIRAFQLLHKRPQLLSAMCLPQGWMVVWDGDDIAGIADDNNEEALR